MRCFCSAQSETGKKGSGCKRKAPLTQTGVDEPVPNAPRAADQPPPLRAGGEAEGRPEHGDQQVADGDADQQQVHGRAQSPVPAEQRQHQEVGEEPEGADEAQAHRHHQVSARAQGRRRQRPGHLLERVRRRCRCRCCVRRCRRAASSSPGTVHTAQAHVANDHSGLKFGAAPEVCTVHPGAGAALPDQPI